VRTFETIDLHAVCGAANSPACAAAIGAASDFWGENGGGAGYGGLVGLAGGTLKSLRGSTIGSAGWIPGGALIGATVGHYAAPPLARFATRHFSSACR
jgi:hypothetical protein